MSGEEIRRVAEAIIMAERLADEHWALPAAKDLREMANGLKAFLHARLAP